MTDAKRRGKPASSVFTLSASSAGFLALFSGPAPVTVLSATRLIPKPSKTRATPTLLASELAVVAAVRSAHADAYAGLAVWRPTRKPSVVVTASLF